MPKDSRKRSRSKSPSSSKKKDRDRRSPAHERDRDRRERERERERRERRRSRSRERRRRDDRKRRSKSDSKSPSPGPSSGNASSSAAAASSSSSSKSKSRGNSLGPAAPGLNIEGALKFKDEGPLDNEAEQKRLETEMQKRRERIEKWRAEKKARDMGLIPGGSGTTAAAATGGKSKESTPVPKSVKKWNLSDDEEDDDDAANGGEPPSKVKKEICKEEKEEEKAAAVVKKEESEDEIDPLDAFMMGIQKEVRSIGAKVKPTVVKGGVKKGVPEANGGIAITTATTTTKPVKMETDAPEIKKEAKEESSPTPPPATNDGAEVGANGNGEVKPLLEFKKNKKVVTIVTGVAVKKTDAKKKGTLMEQNQDALEYSSEEEDASVETLMENLENKNKKDFKFLDHNKIEYKEFRKDFYIEVSEIANMTPEEVASYRVELEGIKVLGKNAPNPIKTWVQCGISSKELQVIKKMNFEKPTPIQAQAIPCIMSGRDVIGIAKTGSGKTLAFLLPLFRHVLDQPPLEEGDGPIAVIMTPTRELAMQIAKDCKKFCKYLDLNVVCVYGGTGISEQIAELKKGAEIIVCTPGRMIDMLAANSGRVTNLTRVTYIVMDEADRMFDLGFEPQVMRIIDNARPDRQIVLFSATFPRQMEALARRLLVRPIEIQVGGRSVVGKDITQTIHVTEDDDQKYLKLLELLGLYCEQGSVIIFVDKQEAADELCKTLISASYSSRPLHGGIDQYDRDSTMSDFKSGAVKILIATSVAARGLDVKSLILVVNYDCPNHYEDYVHRCGRTGRAGNKGYAHTFLNADQGRYAGHLIQALEFSECPIPAQLKILWEEYVTARKAEGKDVSKGGGFGGRGFKFDDTEEQLCVDRKKLQKAALGMHDSDDEDGGKDIDQQISDMFAEKKAIREVATPLVAPDALKNQKEAVGVVNKDKLAKAKELAAKLNITRKTPEEVDIMQQATSALLKGDVKSLLNPMSGRNLAESLADKINAKLGYTAPVPSLMSLDVGMGVAEEKEGGGPSNAPTATRYELELEINDFPQTARWRVTSREALNRISEFSEAGITVRGNYIPPGKEPKGDERKLYLAIESLNELAVDRAKIEIQRLIKEELVRLQNSYQPQSKGRYKLT